MDPFKIRIDRLNILGMMKNKIINPKKEEIPDNIFLKCPKCNESVSSKSLRDNYNVCKNCNYHFKLTSRDRLEQIFDLGKYKELFANVVGDNPLNFEGYDEKISTLQEKTDLKEAVICAVGNVGGYKTAIAVMDSRFLMGSMGCAVGEKLTSLIEYATLHRLALIIFSASGGARMQEGIVSLMQMAKTSAAIERHSKAKLLYISVMTNPTTGGVSASFASLGDIIIAEPNALIGFAGARVIEQTIKQKLPEGFQSAEYLLECGFLDNIVHRKDMRNTLIKLLSFHL